MISIEVAQKLVQSHTQALGKQLLLLKDALGFILAEDVESSINMPPFRQSAMDGYALHKHDSLNYKLIGEVKAGDSHHPVLKSGEAVRIFTGAPVPDSANAVVMQEKTEKKGTVILLSATPQINENIRPLAEQVQKGTIALSKGILLTSAAIGFLTSLGITEISVYRKPVIAIVTTGNELIDPGQELPYGKIYESNALMLQNALKSLGYIEVSIHKISDHYEQTHELLGRVISENDLVLITGGISVGDYDFVGRALNELDVHQVFYKVKQKPGKPLYFGKREGTTIFALPGNPAAALSCFYIYVQTALNRLSGQLSYSASLKKAIATTNFIKKGDRPQFLKAIEREGKIEILEGQSSAMLHTFALANALIYMHENTKIIEVGDEVQFIQLPI